MDIEQINRVSSELTPQSKQHTLGHINCPACAEMQKMFICSITADLSFMQAAKIFMQLRSVASHPGAISARYVRLNTEKGYKRYTSSLELFFSEMKLGDIHWYNMRAYQAARVAGKEPFLRYRRPQDAKPKKVGDITIPPKGKTPCPAKPQQVNQELSYLKRLKILASCWSPDDEKYYQPLQEEESDVERALSPEQQQLWLDVCRSNPRWDLILWWSIASFDMLTSTNELRGLQIGNINLHHEIVKIPWPSAKNKFRHREIPIVNAEALWALKQLTARAHSLGATEPQHYLFPFRVTRSKQAFPDKAMTESGIKKLWQEVREASGLLWFRPYDTRHTGATRLAENRVPTEIIVARMGHCSDQQRRHYTHISEQAHRAWLRAAQGANANRPRPEQWNDHQGLPHFSPQPDYSYQRTYRTGYGYAGAR